MPGLNVIALQVPSHPLRFGFVPRLLAFWKFFAQRIPHEEETLSHHFGKERYRNYAEATPIGIPMIPTAIPFKPSAALSAKSGDGGADSILSRRLGEYKQYLLLPQP